MADAMIESSGSSGGSLVSLPSSTGGSPQQQSATSAVSVVVVTGGGGVSGGTSSGGIGGGSGGNGGGSNSVSSSASSAALTLNPIIPMLAAELQQLQHGIGQQQQQQDGSGSAGTGLALTTTSSIGTGGNSNSQRESTTSGEPEPKRKRLDNNGGGQQPTVAMLAAASEKLESRLGGILCCAVCLDLPKGAMYQCQMGHLMCAACFTHLLADGRLRDQVATCPNCRVEISKSTASRNLAVEKAVSELPSECQYCGKEYASKSLERHEQCECEERPTACKYQRIGCQWKGPLHEAHEHQANCSHPKKSGADVMLALEATDATQSEEKRLFNTLIELLSYEKIIFNDLQLKPYRTDEYVHKLFYETSRFSAFNHQWAVKARINNSQRDPHTVNDRQITYQLILKTKTSTPLSIHFFGLKGPFSDMKINTQIYKHDFTDQENESEYYWMPLPDSSECNRLLAAKAINFRLIMFLLSK